MIFKDSVSIEPYGDVWITTDELRYTTSFGDEIVVPKGFVFDGASVPMVFGSLIQRVEPKTIDSACIHDWLYTKGRKYSRSITDGIFRQALLDRGVKWQKAYIMWLGVRLGGWLYWYKIV